MSIIELMVGIVVALFVSLAATGSAMMFTASQRQGIGSGGAIVNASTALTAIKSDAALVGLGFFNSSASLCTNLNLSVGATLVSDGAAFSPLQVVRAPDLDRLDVVYATVIESGTNVQLRSPSDGSSAELTSLLPAAVGQLVMLAPEGPGDPCTIRTVTAVNASTATTAQTIDFAASGAQNGAAFTLSPAYATRARVALLGDLSWNRYRVDGSGNLILERPLTNASAILVRDVMAFRVQYGISANAASTTLDDWVDATGAWATLTALNIRRVRALRIGVMVRSPQMERRDAGGVCRATETAPQLFGAVPVTLTGPDWGCFRYRVTTSVVPLRNVVL